MKKNSITVKRGLLLSITCLVISSLIVIFIPYADIDGSAGQKLLSYALGIIFWVGLLSGWIILLWLNRNLKHQLICENKKILPGVLRFFSNPLAVITDIGLLLSIVLNILTLSNLITNMVLSSLFAALLLVTFHLHYIVNGKVYMYFKNRIADN